MKEIGEAGEIIDKNRPSPMGERDRLEL